MRRPPSPPWGRDEFDLYGIHGQARRADAGCLASSFGDASVDRRCFGDLRSGGSLAPLSPLGCVTVVVSLFSPAVCPLLPVRALISRTVCAPLCLAAWCCVSAFVLCCIVLCLESAALGSRLCACVHYMFSIYAWNACRAYFRSWFPLRSIFLLQMRETNRTYPFQGRVAAPSGQQYSGTHLFYIQHSSYTLSRNTCKCLVRSQPQYPASIRHGH